MLDRLKQIVSWPFKYAYEMVDTRPSGGTIRKTVRSMTAVEGEKKGEVRLVVGEGRSRKKPVVMVLSASTAVEGVNETLKMVGSLRRSKARAIRNADKAVIEELKVNPELASEGKAGRGKTTPSTPSAAAPGPVLV